MIYIEEKELAFFRDGKRIYGKEFMPVDDTVLEAEKAPAIILSHGFGGSGRDMEFYCRAFVQKGYVAYCFDFCGGSVGETGRSEGSSLEMTIETECRDLLAVYESVKAFPHVDAGRISLMGGSQGGFISALVAARLGDAVENLILLYPALCIPDHARAGRLGGACYDVERVPEVIVCPNQMKLSRRFHEEVATMDPYLEIGKYKGRVLLMHGMRDEIVNYSYAVKAKETYEKGQCSFMLMRDAGHGFNAGQDESAVIAMEHFLDKKRELLTIHVIITGTEILVDREQYQERAVRFVGYCDNELFRGTILPEGLDVQKQYGDEPAILKAEYTLVGRDCEMKECSIHIVNQKKGSRYKPELTTDSEALSWLSDLDLTAALEGFPGGLTVRIFG